MSINDKLDQAIEKLAQIVIDEKDVNSGAALHFTQAALNLAHAKETLANAGK